MKILGLIFFTLLFPASVFAVSIGMNPSRISEQSALAGSEMTYTVFLHKDQEVPAVFDTVLEGEIGDWIQYEDSLSIPASKSSSSTRIFIKVPEDVSLGTYQGALTYIVRGEEIDLGLHLPIEITVTDIEKDSYTIRHAEVQHTEKGILVSYMLHNKGNVLSGPTKVFLQVFDSKKQRTIFSGEKQIIEVSPFTYAEQEVFFPADIDFGSTGQI